MNLHKTVTDCVTHAYHVENIHCTPTTLRALSQLFKIKLNEQVLHASEGMNGAGLYGAQCGLVEGALMFNGILSKHNGLCTEDILAICSEFAEGFERKLGSLICRELRPEGFSEEITEHICEPRSVEAIIYAAEFLSDIFGIKL